MKIRIISKQTLIIQRLKIIFKDPTFQKYNITEISVNDWDNKINNSSSIYLIDEKETLFLEQNSIKHFKVLVGNNFNSFLYYKYHFDFYLSIESNIKDLEYMITVYQNTKSKYNKIILHSNYNIFQISINNIFFIEKRNRKTYVITKDGIISINDNFNELKSHLTSYGFVIPHYSFLVNTLYIESVNSLSITLKNNMIIPISRSHKNKLFGYDSKCYDSE